MKRRDFLSRFVLGGAGVVLTTYGLASAEYMDVFGFGGDAQIGRTKNSVAVLVTGLVGQKLYGNSNIDVNIKKSLWPDAKVTGYTTPNSVETHVDLTFASAHFSAKKNRRGLLEGEVDKSEFDWKVKQTGPNTYDVARAGPKFDASLELKVKDGKISGTYVRTGPHFDWDIKGTYDKKGNVNFEIDGPLNLGITLNGKITPK